MKILVGSSSDRKVRVVEKVFATFVKQRFEVSGHNAVSGVPDTPYNKETFDGSRNRALDCKNSHEAEYYVGLESGLTERYGQLYEEAWATIITKEGKEFFGYSSGLKIPDLVVRRMKESKLEHCEVMTIIEEEFGKLPNDTWGTYSGGSLSREVSLEEALRNALMQIMPGEGALYLK